jgi:hypothetical protein
MQPNMSLVLPRLINWQRRIHEANDPSESSGVQALTNSPTDAGSHHDTQRTYDIAQGGIGSQTGNTNPNGCDAIVPAIVISHG